MQLTIVLEWLAALLEYLYLFLQVLSSESGGSWPLSPCTAYVYIHIYYCKLFLAMHPLSNTFRCQTFSSGHCIKSNNDNNTIPSVVVCVWGFTSPTIYAIHVVSLIMWYIINNVIISLFITEWKRLPYICCCCIMF